MEVEWEIRVRGRVFSPAELVDAILGEPEQLILRASVYHYEERVKERHERLYCPHHGAPKHFKVVVTASTIDSTHNPSMSIEGCCKDFQNAAHAILTVAD